MFDDKQERLEIIEELVDDALRSLDMMVTTQHLLAAIKEIISGEKVSIDGIMAKPPKKKKIIISCDATIKDGHAAIGVVIQVPDKPDQFIKRSTGSTTINQAEYDAIYTGVTTLLNLINVPKWEVEVRSDSQIAIRQLIGEYECNDPILQNKKQCILNFLKATPATVIFKWRPRCSDMGLKLADQLAKRAWQEAEAEAEEFRGKMNKILKEQKDIVVQSTDKDDIVDTSEYSYPTGDSDA